MANFGFLASNRFALLLALLVFTAWQVAFIAAVDTTSMPAPRTGDFMDTINTKEASLSPRASFGKKRLAAFGVGSLVAGACFCFSHVFMDSSNTLKLILQGVSAMLYIYAAVQMLFFKKHFAALHTLFVFVLPIVSTPLMFFLIPSLSHLVVLQETVELPSPSTTAFGAAMASAVNSDSVKVFMDKIVKAVKAATSAISAANNDHTLDNDKVKAAVIRRLFETPGGYVAHLLEASDKKAAYENVVALATSMKHHFSEYCADAENFPFAENIDAAKKAYAAAVVTAKGPALQDVICCLRALVDGLEDSNKSKYAEQIEELFAVVIGHILKPFLDLLDQDKITKDQSEGTSAAIKELKSLDSVLLNSHAAHEGDDPLFKSVVEQLDKVVAKPQFSAEEEIKGYTLKNSTIDECIDDLLHLFRLHQDNDYALQKNDIMNKMKQATESAKAFLKDFNMKGVADLESIQALLEKITTQASSGLTYAFINPEDTRTTALFSDELKQIKNYMTLKKVSNPASVAELVNTCEQMAQLPQDNSHFSTALQTHKDKLVEICENLKKIAVTTDTATNCTNKDKVDAFITNLKGKTVNGVQVISDDDIKALERLSKALIQNVQQMNADVRALKSADNLDARIAAYNNALNHREHYITGGFITADFEAAMNEAEEAISNDESVKGIAAEGTWPQRMTNLAGIVDANGVKVFQPLITNIAAVLLNLKLNNVAIKKKSDGLPACCAELTALDELQQEADYKNMDPLMNRIRASAGEVRACIADVDSIDHTLPANVGNFDNAVNELDTLVGKIKLTYADCDLAPKNLDRVFSSELAHLKEKQVLAKYADVNAASLPTRMSEPLDAADPTRQTSKDKGPALAGVNRTTTAAAPSPKASSKTEIKPAALPPNGTGRSPSVTKNEHVLKLQELLSSNLGNIGDLLEAIKIFYAAFEEQQKNNSDELSRLLHRCHTKLYEVITSLPLSTSKNEVDAIKAAIAAKPETMSPIPPDSFLDPILFEWARQYHNTELKPIIGPAPISLNTFFGYASFDVINVILDAIPEGKCLARLKDAHDINANVKAVASKLFDYLQDQRSKVDMLVDTNINDAYIGPLKLLLESLKSISFSIKFDCTNQLFLSNSIATLKKAIAGRDWAENNLQVKPFTDFPGPLESTLDLFTNTIDKLPDDVNLEFIATSLTGLPQHSGKVTLTSMRNCLWAIQQQLSWPGVDKAKAVEALSKLEFKKVFEDHESFKKTFLATCMQVLNSRS